MEPCLALVFQQGPGCNLLAIILEVRPDRAKLRDVTVGADLPFFGDQVGSRAILSPGSEQESTPVPETKAAKIEAMNHRTCRAPGCWAPTASCFGAYCPIAKRQRKRLRYHEFSPKAAIFLGHWLATAHGVGDQGIAKAEQAERDWKAKERLEPHEALSKRA